MSYTYSAFRHTVFTEEGQVRFLRVRDKAKELLEISGAVTCVKLMVGGGDTWELLACIDRLVELGELIKIPNPTSSAGQHQIYIGPPCYA